MKKILPLFVVFASLTLSISAQRAKLVIGETETNYTSLSEAVNAANQAKGAPVVQLLDDVDLGGEQLNLTHTMKMDFMGHTISGYGANMLNVTGEGTNVTLLDSGTGEGGINCTDVDEEATIVRLDGATLTMQSGVVYGGNFNDNTPITVLGIADHSTFNMEGGSLQSSLKVNAPVIKASGSNTILNISGGEINTEAMNSGSTAVRLNDCSCTISGGDIKCNGVYNAYGVIQNGGQLTIKGGTFAPVSTTEYYSYAVGVYAIGAKVDVQDGLLKPKGERNSYGLQLASKTNTTITGGKFLPSSNSNNAKDFVLDSTSQLKISGGYFSAYVKNMQQYLEGKYVASFLPTQAPYNEGYRFYISDTEVSLGEAVNLFRGKIYDSLIDAMANAQFGDVISLTKDYTLKQDLTIPLGVTLLIPYDTSLDCYHRTPCCSPEVSFVAENRTLTLADGVTLTVKGTLNIGAHQNACNGDDPKGGGAVWGYYAAINMGKGAVIDLDGALYCWGYIYGEGKVNAKSTCTIFESMMITDWHGGTISSQLYEDIFPLNQVYVQNIEVPVTFNYGAKELLTTSFSTTMGILIPEQVSWIGKRNAFINLQKGSSLTRTYDAKTDRMSYAFTGDVNLGSFSLGFSGQSLGTEKFSLGLNHNWDISISKGTLSMPYSYHLLPGCNITVNKEATLSLAKNQKLSVYGKKNYGLYAIDYIRPLLYTHANGYNNSSIRCAGSANSQATLDKMTVATLNINGRLEMNGQLYSSEGARVYSSEGTGMIRYHENVADTTAYLYNIVGITTELQKMYFTPALLTNADESQVKTEKATSGMMYAMQQNAWKPFTFIASANKASYATYSSAYDVAIQTDGVEAYKASISGDKILLTPLDGYIPAGTGVLLRFAEGVASVEFDTPATDATAANVTDNALQPTTTAAKAIVERPTGTLYALGGENAFLRYNGELIANRAFLLMDTPAEGKMQIIVDEETSIATMPHATSQHAKFLEKGRMIIQKNGQKYNTFGQKVM